ncbi:FecR domain-containing protein [Variovorax sp. dw_954]|uniref:FecR family protein n=1 Tax=Variovorax sp. dw_954 TaxID=2720078 RepID=UPI001BD50FA8|nr:FecR domain-containing protein [Variovorax sp. dw_954]
MNIRTGLALFALVCATATASAQTPATPAAPTPATPTHAGFVKNLRGDVKLLDANGVMRAARTGDEVSPVERVVTGPDSGASVVLRDGTVLVIGPSSRLDLKGFSYESTTQDGNVLVALLRGSLRMITGLIGKSHPDAVRIETQTATIGIRGTDFIVEVEPQ